MERDEARQEVEDLKNFLGTDLEVSHDPNQTTTDPEQLRVQRDRARESLATKRVMLEDAQEAIEALKEGLETCQGSLVEAEQKDRQKYEKKMRAIEAERDQLVSKVADLLSKLEVSVTAESAQILRDEIRDNEVCKSLYYRYFTFLLL
jgi:predicted  nucleic acid-binding Zn-ribbon protein